MLGRLHVPVDVVAVVLVTLAASTVGAMLSGNTEFIFYIVVLMILSGLVVAVHARVRFSPWLLRGLALWAVLHMAGGLVPVPSTWPINGEDRVLYSWWLIPGRLKYDQVVHAFGFGVTTWAFWQGVRSMAGPRRPTAGWLFVCVCAGMGAGAMNEVVEFIAVLTIPETNVGGYRNTGWDLVANLVGCVGAALLIRFGSRRDAR